MNVLRKGHLFFLQAQLEHVQKKNKKRKKQR